MTKQRVLQGMRPSGRLHLGNYLGTAKGMLALQNDPAFETFYMVADLHGMTTPFDSQRIGPNAVEVMLDYLSIGLDPKKSALFLQSDLADLHVQLAYYFSTVVSVGRMQDLPTFKEKVRQYPQHVTMALLNYPVLMAADILIYKASMVPVGIDQEPHMEITREIARKMNSFYGTDFPEPKSFETKMRYIPSLTGEGKMSKSVEGSSISLTDSLAEINKRLAAVPTDSGKGEIKMGDRGREYVSSGQISFGVGALMQFVELFQGVEQRKLYEEQYGSTGVRYGDLKNKLAEAIFRELEPIQERRKEFEKNPDEVQRILRDGAARARVVAETTVGEVRRAMGLRSV